MGHIELARWADLILIAPASADVIARLASGKGDDLLNHCLFGIQSPLGHCTRVLNQAMYSHVATLGQI